MAKGDLRGKLDQFNSHFALECDKLRNYCDELNTLHTSLQSKLTKCENRDIENLDIYLQLDAKMRSVENHLIVGKALSLKGGPSKTQDSDCQTEIGYDELVRREANLQVL